MYFIFIFAQRVTDGVRDPNLELSFRGGGRLQVLLGRSCGLPELSHVSLIRLGLRVSVVCHATSYRV